MQGESIYLIQLRIKDKSRVNIHERKKGKPVLSEFWQDDGVTPKPLPGTDFADQKHWRTTLTAEQGWTTVEVSTEQGSQKRWLTVLTKDKGWVTLEVAEGIDPEDEKTAQERACCAFERHRYQTLQPLKALRVNAELRVVVAQINEVLNTTDCDRGIQIHS